MAYWQLEAIALAKLRETANHCGPTSPLLLPYRTMGPRTRRQASANTSSQPKGSMKETSAGPSHPLPVTTKHNTLKRKHKPSVSPGPPSSKLNGSKLLSSSTSNMSSQEAGRSRGHRKIEPRINEFPQRRAEKGQIFVFGEGAMGELGLGPTLKDRNVKRPRLNVRLAEAGIVDVAVGGMHVAALDYQGRVWTWGVNDQGSLGRSTKVLSSEAKMKQMSDRDSDTEEEEDELLNELESTPGLVEDFPEEVKIVKLACGDSISVAIGNDGNVYSWGTFRVSYSTYDE